MLTLGRQTWENLSCWAGSLRSLAKEPFVLAWLLTVSTVHYHLRWFYLRKNTVYSGAMDSLLSLLVAYFGHGGQWRWVPIVNMLRPTVWRQLASKPKVKEQKQQKMVKVIVFLTSIHPSHRIWAPFFRCWRAMKVFTELCEDPPGHMWQTICLQRWPQQYLPSHMLFCNVTLLLLHPEMGLTGHLSLNLAGFSGSHVR